MCQIGSFPLQCWQLLVSAVGAPGTPPSALLEALSIATLEWPTCTGFISWEFSQEASESTSLVPLAPMGKIFPSRHCSKRGQPWNFSKPYCLFLTQLYTHGCWLRGVPAYRSDASPCTSCATDACSIQKTWRARNPEISASPSRAQ